MFVVGLAEAALGDAFAEGLSAPELAIKWCIQFGSKALHLVFGLFIENVRSVELLHLPETEGQIKIAERSSQDKGHESEGCSDALGETANLDEHIIHFLEMTGV